MCIYRRFCTHIYTHLHTHMLGTGVVITGSTIEAAAVHSFFCVRLEQCVAAVHVYSVEVVPLRPRRVDSKEAILESAHVPTWYLHGAGSGVYILA